MTKSDPKIRQLAKAAAREIKALTNAHNDQIAGIYRDFRIQADALLAEASTKSLTRSGADLLSQTTSDLGDS